MGTLPRPPPRRPDRKPGPPQRIGFVPAEVDQLLPPLFRLDANTFDRGFVVDETMDGVSPVDSGFTSSIRPRRYLLHVPEAVQLMLEDPANKERVPLVLVFHGMSSDILYEAGHVIDTNRIYAIGLSNGGMFLTTLLLDPRFRFSASCVYMGGYVKGHNPSANRDHTLTPVLLITGSEDKMLPYSRDAELVFRVAGHPVEFDEVAGMEHEYRTEHEERIWEFFAKHSLKQE
ncbi:uncharacterized protein ACA1_323830 [Acanthamoeba castellanii str. Neff]|uniref:Phospholipase/carboxylesterase/thioesterase domain-containing protein n=1 Tax=Acanthamoeba castellanii (strain ATCC 30010 / Neff) TaxID=1257118 RepID=L8HBR1_ACACF|nr:uncharacterized protein ACA1_323830 [Acanthamoeba castellanii str. Neff]ELR22620.1 hypothetical protein ACA1_323830 [Acanthamoeba castellanii str. Neff]